MANQKELVGILNAQIIEYFNLSTNFVYIGEQNKEHIKNKHYEDYSKYYRCNYFRHFLSHRDEYCPLFTYEQVFAWFREKGLYGNIEAGSKYNSIYIFSDNDLDMGSNIYPTYEEAREELLKRLIKIYKENI